MNWLVRLFSWLQDIFSDWPQPTVPPTPPVPETPTIGVDEITPSIISWDGMISPATWPITATLTNVKIDGNFIWADRSPMTGWDERQEASWSKPCIGNWWVIGKKNGQWRATTIEWLGPGKVRCERKPTNPPGHDDIRGGLSDWYPASGEWIGLMQSSFGGRDGKTRGTKNQRTNIVLVQWP